MMPRRDLSQAVLQIVFSFFLGLVVVAFVGIALNTFYPELTTSSTDAVAWDTWRLVTGTLLLICATLVMVASMLIPSESVPVITNGILLGGLFTMIYAVIMSLSATNDWARLAVIAGAFVVTVGVAYWKFGVRKTAPTALPAGPPDQISPVDPGLPARVDRLERRLDDLRKALAE
jgi:Na+/melibiose symporter-like transporter